MASGLPAQQGTIAGLVFDSVTMRPVAGAVVQAVARDAPAGQMHSAVTDAAGQYELHLPPAGYFVVFEHAALDSLGVKLEPLAVEVTNGGRTVGDLAVPSPKRIVWALCGEAVEEIGAVVGFLRDARTGNPVDTGTVEASWHELTIRKGAMRYEEIGTEVRVRSDGWFTLCGVAPEGEAFIMASRRGDSTGAVLLSIPDHGLVRRDLFIGGTARLSGMVRTDRGPLRGAEIRISGRDRAAIADSVGRFVLSPAPAGTQSLEVRALGFMPERALVNLTADGDTTIDFRLTKLGTVMDTIHVVAERVYASRLLSFNERKARGGAGTFYDADRIARTGEKDLYGILQRIPGIRVSTWRGGKRVTMRDARADCVPTLYIDRSRVDAGGVINELGDVLPLVEIGGIEVYRGANTPAEFPGVTGCGTIVIWTQPVARE